ncbi:MAG: Beta-galactosidase, partial [Candidatus Ordinivivax streblomastigis]
MKRTFLSFVIVTISVICFSGNKNESSSTAGRKTLLVMQGWNLWYDASATWVNDSLYLPQEVNIAALALKAPEPTGGWQTLDRLPEGGFTVNLPAIVEEYFTPDGNVKTSIPGVYWFWKDVDIPSDWKDKTVQLKIESARLRIEVFANAQLTGYDIVGDIPYNCNLTKALIYGKCNRIAIRVTNPGGNPRGWEDYGAVKWGSYLLPASRDFGGINGKVELIATDNTYIDDIYIKNLSTPGYKTIEIQATINNSRTDLPARIKYEIIPVSGRKAIYTQTDAVWVSESRTVVKRQITCPKAVLWDIESPGLYVCKVTLLDKNNNRKIDSDSRKFGFRVFEIKIADGDTQAHYFVNGKRMIFKGGIDFGYYAFTGAYPTEEMAVKSVQAAKSIGQNAFNFHRRIGYPVIMDKADELGLFLYEEPGGFHAGGQGYDVSANVFSAALMKEKMRRMVIRDRSHPSLIIYNLCNEDNNWNSLRQEVMEETHMLDETRLVVNSSGSNNGGYAVSTQHIRPYENTIRTDFTDNHTVGAIVLFDEGDFEAHIPKSNAANILYWGEVKCYAGPENWYEIGKAFSGIKRTKGSAYKGYNYSYYLAFGEKLEVFFKKHRMSESGSGIIQSPGDIPRMTGGGKMYNDGRNAQNILSYDQIDGYAINAWSGGNGLEGWSGWYSGIVDDGRNVKGDPVIYAYYTRPLQVVIQRKVKKDGVGGKTFDTSGKPAFKIKLINQGLLPKGEYTLKLKLKDGAGKYHDTYDYTMPVKVEGGNVYAQDINTNYVFTLNNSLRGGFITLEGKLYDRNNKEIADGAEQILLTNRSSFSDYFTGLTGEVYGWSAARMALENANMPVTDFNPGKA